MDVESILNNTHTPFLNIPPMIKNRLLRGLYRAGRPLIENVLAIDHINRLHNLHCDRIQTFAHSPHPEYFDYLLSVFDTQVNYCEAELDRIPQTGTVLVVANHPFGGLDGIALSSVVLKRRQDMRLMSNHFLELIPGLKPWLCSVDPFETRDALKLNLSGMKQAYRWLNHGGCMSSFPSGSVSHWQLKTCRIEDPAWHDNLARLARKTQATVVPVFIEGHNSWSFQMAGLIHPLLRTALLGRELINNKQVVTLNIREPITPDRFKPYHTDAELAAFFKAQTYQKK